LGSITSLIDKISCHITVTSSQNSFIFGHDHIQWNNVPLSSPHLLQRSGTCILNLLSFSGVMYTLISQLNCSSFRRVLPVCVWANLHALLHCSTVNSSCKSDLHALSLAAEDSGEDVISNLYISEIIPLPKGFLVRIFSSADNGGNCAKSL